MFADIWTLSARFCCREEKQSWSLGSLSEQNNQNLDQDISRDIICSSCEAGSASPALMMGVEGISHALHLHILSRLAIVTKLRPD